MAIEIVYDGTSASVEKIMDALGRTAGVNNTPDYLLLDERCVGKGETIVVESDKKWHIKKKA